jgi:hypothetical protein
VPYNAVEAERLVDDSKIGETLSWLAAMKRLTEASGRRFLVTLIPVGTVDPAYVEFWQPWPRYYSYAVSSAVRHKRLALALRKDKMRVIDLRDDLNNVAGTYRLTDGHWTEKGTRIAASRIASELGTLLGKPIGAGMRRKEEPS